MGGSISENNDASVIPSAPLDEGPEAGMVHSGEGRCWQFLQTPLSCAWRPLTGSAFPITQGSCGSCRVQGAGCRAESRPGVRSSTLAPITVGLFASVPSFSNLRYSPNKNSPQRRVVGPDLSRLSPLCWSQLHDLSLSQNMATRPKPAWKPA